MQKAIFKITGIMLGNLLAFIVIGLILDALFKTDGVLILAMVLVSLPVFGIIMYLKAGKILQELHSINKNIDGSK